MIGSKSQIGRVSGGGSGDQSDMVNNSDSVKNNTAARHKRLGVTRVMPKEGKKRVNYSKGNARRIMEEAVSLCEAMSLGYEVVFHGRRRSCAAHKSSLISEGMR